MRRILSLLVVVLVLAACEVRIPPAATDPGITRAFDDHLVVFDEHRPLGDRLFVFLPGTGGTPDGYAALLREVAAQGMPAIGLMYPNGRKVNGTLCPTDASEPNCSEQVREEIVYGVDRSSKIVISPANSIVNRLVKLLQHLGWTQFLDGNQPTVGSPRRGRSLPGRRPRGHRGARPSGRACVFFASPGDWAAGTAPWLLEPRATPTDRYYGFGHVDDGGAFLANWNALGLLGPLTSVDGSSPPYGGSHRLLTDAPVANPHVAVAVNATRYATVWDHLCCS